MSFRRILGLASAALALFLVPSAAALAAGTSVTVRVEGNKRTLLAPKVVHTHAGAITKGGAPAGSCPATSAAGALDVATHHRWGGKYSSGLGIEVTSILGEKHPFSSSSFWEIWVDNRPANFGVCDLKLHRGEQLLFAPAPDKGTIYPTAIKGPRKGTKNVPFKLRAVYYTNAGQARPLAGARLHQGGHSVVTNQQGYATVDPITVGKFKFTVTKQGYIRSAPKLVRVP